MPAMHEGSTVLQVEPAPQTGCGWLENARLIGVFGRVRRVRVENGVLLNTGKRFHVAGK
ncbi:hypothetical protein [Pseudomonas helleri]|uniref:hypothetical protein n=1 Tax=Pseudomonas helleri TaxID=1608996 RepID=UPI001E4C70F0|nr:hypothetical protein [Pseudomonas helleri]